MKPIERIICNVFKENLIDNTKEIKEILDGENFDHDMSYDLSKAVELWFINYYLVKGLYQVTDCDETIEDLILHIRSSLLQDVNWNVVVELICELDTCPKELSRLLKNSAIA